MTFQTYLDTDDATLTANQTRILQNKEVTLSLVFEKEVKTPRKM